MKEDGTKVRIEKDGPINTHLEISKLVTWGVALGITTKIGSVIVTLVLVRLLSPEIYGQYGLVAAVLMFALAFSMQRFMEHSFHVGSDAEDSDKYHLGFGVLLHLAVFVVFNLVCFILPLPEKYDAVKYYLHIGSFAILLNVPRIYYSTYLRRALNWKRQRFIHLVSFLLSAVGSIGLALSGFGVMALLAQNLLVPVPYIVDLVWRRPGLLVFSFNLAYYKDAIRFGVVRSGSAIVSVGQKLVEASVFTAIAGFISFGVYGRAIGLGALGAAWLSDQINNLMYPVLGKVPPHSDQSRRAAGLILRLTIWTSVPMAVALSVVNDAAVHILYGAKWGDVSVLLPAVMSLAVITTITSGLRLVILTNHGPKKVLAVDVVLLVLCIAGLSFVLERSVLFYCWFLSISGFFVLTIMVLRLISERLLDYRELSGAVAPMLVVLAVFLLTGTYFDLDSLQQDFPVLALLLAVIGANALALLFVRIFDADGLRRALVYVPSGARLTAMLRL